MTVTESAPPVQNHAPELVRARPGYRTPTRCSRGSCSSPRPRLRRQRRASRTYLNNRYHDPATGVFLSVDPLVAKTGMPYLYAAGNPTTLSDPSGLEPCGRNGTCTGEYADQKDIVAYNNSDGRGPATCNYHCGLNDGWGNGPGGMNHHAPSVGMYPAGVGGRGLTGGDLWYSCQYFGGSCGAPPSVGEYSSEAGFRSALDYLSTWGGMAADGMGGLSDAATVTVAGYQRANGTLVASYTRYRAGLGDLRSVLPASAGTLKVAAKWMGPAFVALSTGLTGWDAWQESGGEPSVYRVGYTMVTTASLVGGAWLGAAIGAKAGAAIGSVIAPGPGTAVGAFAGGLSGGLVGAVAGRQVARWSIEAAG